MGKGGDAVRFGISGAGDRIADPENAVQDFKSWTIEMQAYMPAGGGAAGTPQGGQHAPAA